MASSLSMCCWVRKTSFKKPSAPSPTNLADLCHGCYLAVQVLKERLLMIIKKLILKSCIDLPGSGDLFSQCQKPGVITGFFPVFIQVFIFSQLRSMTHMNYIISAAWFAVKEFCSVVTCFWKCNMCNNLPKFVMRIVWVFVVNKWEALFVSAKIKAL